MKQVISILLSSSMLIACQNGQQSVAQNTTESSTIESSIISAPFDADTAYNYIRYQVSLGPRTPGSTSHKDCGNWIENQLKSWEYKVINQTFLGKDYKGVAIQGRNIIASLQPELSNRLLLMAHWDTRPVADEEINSNLRNKPINGADDGASGVAVLMELARQWKDSSLKVGIDIIFFDLEDGGQSGDNDSWCLGSQYWAKHPHKPNYTAKGGILLDMVGARNARFHWEGYSKTYAAPLLMELWDIAKTLGHITYFPHSEGGTITDDHIPVIENLGIPCVDIVNYSYTDNRQGFGNHWHTHQDNMEIIDKSTLEAVGQTVSTYIQKLNTK